MVGTVKGGDRGQSLVQVLSALGRGKPQSAAKLTITDPKAVERQRQQQEALDALKRANDDMKRQKKAAAAAKVERLKRELEQLRLFAGIGDPKAAARQVARIARELSAAVREYRAGGGQPSPAEAAPAKGGAETAAAGEDAEAARVEADAAPTQSEAEEGNPAQKEATGQVLTPQEKAEKEREEFRAGIEKSFGENQRRHDERNADARFANEVREVAAKLKSLMAELKAKAEREGDGESETARMLRAAATDLDDVDQVLNGLVEVFPPVDVTT